MADFGELLGRVQNEIDYGLTGVSTYSPPVSNTSLILIGGITLVAGAAAYAVLNSGVQQVTQSQRKMEALRTETEGYNEYAIAGRTQPISMVEPARERGISIDNGPAPHHTPLSMELALEDEAYFDASDRLVRRRIRQRGAEKQ